MNFTGLEDLGTSSIETILTFPNTGDVWFWGKILLAIWVIIASANFFRDEERTKANFLASAGISSLAVIVLAFIGTLFGVITNAVMMITLAFGMVFIALWLLTSE